MLRLWYGTVGRMLQLPSAHWLCFADHSFEVL